MIEVTAPAKINLCLHVTGRRADGYHLLDSLVVFAGVGDVLTLAPGPLALRLAGPEAGALPPGPDNLVLRAAHLMGAEAQMSLTKNLPVASGIGGGSADAAAALRGLAQMHGRAAPSGADLGADVPVCLAAHPARMRGIGTDLAPLPPLPPLWLVLVNPRQAVATPAVFAALTARDNPPLPDLPAQWGDAAGFAAFLRAQRNDLAPAAQGLCPSITEVLAQIKRSEGCLLARMSGSGATCFGLYASAAAAQAAARALRRPPWWVAAAPVLGPAPQLTRETI